MPDTDDSKGFIHQLDLVKQFLVDPWVLVFEERFKRSDERFEAFMTESKRLAEALDIVAGQNGYVPRDEIGERFEAVYSTIRWIIGVGLTAGMLFVAAFAAMANMLVNIVGRHQ